MFSHLRTIISFTALCIASPALALAPVYNLPWTFQGSGKAAVAQWCLDASECHQIVCHQDRLHYKYTGRRDKNHPATTPFLLAVDKSVVASGQLVKSDQSGWISKQELSVGAVGALITGAKYGVRLFDRELYNSLNGSGRAIKALIRACSGMYGAPPATVEAQPDNTPRLRSTVLSNLCAPYRNQVRQVGRRVFATSAIGSASEFFDFINRQGTRESYHDRGLVKNELSYYNQTFTSSTVYHGIIANAPLGFSLRMPASDSRINQDGMADLLKIKQLALKFFEWRKVAMAQGLQEFSKPFPPDLAPSISDRLNFKFVVSASASTGVSYRLQHIGPHGICWLYSRALSAEADIQKAKRAMADAKASEERKQQSQQELSDQFQ